MPSNTSYLLGKAFGRIPSWVGVLLVAFVGLLLFRTCSTTHDNTLSKSVTRPAVLAASTPQELSAQEVERKKSACEASLVSKREVYASRMKERKYWEAALEIRQCAEVLGNSDLAALVKDAEIKSFLGDINNPKTSIRDRVLAMQKLVRDYPDIGRKYQAEIPRLTAAADKQEAAAEARRKRSQGVRIGMSKADAIASSWGRPEKVNRTTNQYGTREQWVYGGGNYLYFEDDTLVSIQN